ncbi:MAG: hypothetical protein UY23_C0004G0020 [Candidatus Jorgensenbacteria bacterium GW2011_GWA1_48_11]|uniref:UPF0235 protein UY23_C0004G0020 n=1 Tax=Candidatus Jorgensenbacteria bacterium GW2011_GWA1_48_11 TaxID=1618660 RepID=A0A0G1X9Q2_9BACT|nr:MAG: hypothetical protein UY23_C0004G0020 [Candidatus Jorgensenbacteria bacterium GW2011_GWA1_48_11]KKW11799.1 MAG: hypothetical protein UY51_C0005G0040 [Candidatus Jorgensenbacteria bacterium GW2011_GWB1_49_9]
MRISVQAKPNAKIEKIEKVSETEFLVSVKEPPKEGKANQAIGRTLAEYFQIPFSNVRLVSGFSSRQKTFEIIREF